MITYEDFQKIELRVVKITEAESVDGSEKLLKITISLGEEKRQIIAGLGKFYNPSDLLGKNIVIVANMEPKKLMGLESQGMLLATDGDPILIVSEKEVVSGTKIR